MKRLATALALALAAGSAIATDAIVTLGEARVRYDDTRWKALPLEGSVSFEPQGEAMRKVDPVELRVVDASAPCEELAARAFALGPYDERDLKPAPTRIAGIPGVRITAHTRCRNATPVGVVACVRVGTRAYLLRALQVGCRGRNLFSGIDPLGEIAAGITFIAR